MSPGKHLGFAPTSRAHWLRLVASARRKLKPVLVSGPRRRRLFYLVQLKRSVLGQACDIRTLHTLSRAQAPEADLRVPTPIGPAIVTREGYTADRTALFEVFLAREYETDYRDAVVVDVGAHKGYFALYALSRGALHVHSFEPVPENYEVLARSRNEVASGHGGWTTTRSAVGSHSGQLSLQIYAESSSHSVVRRPDRQALRELRVPVCALSEVLGHAAADARRLIVKIDAEGSECAIVRGTPARTWSMVDEAFVEHHSYAECSKGDLIDHLHEARLELRDETRAGAQSHELLHFKRVGGRLSG